MSAEKQPSFREILQAISAIAMPNRGDGIRLLVGTVVLAAILIWLWLF